MRVAALLTACLGLLLLGLAGLLPGGPARADETPGAAAPDTANPAGPSALVVRVKGAIGPATSSHILKALDAARSRNARVVVLHLDTPGGLDSSMRDIIQGILASPVPVITYVAPSGARAASAGTYILYASHVAAMAPATNLGAATPVQIGGAEPPARPAGGDGDAKDKDKDKDKEAAPAPGTAMERKAVNDAVAYIRGLAQLRGRNAEWAEQAVRSAVSLDAEAALKQNVIDVIAPDIPALLEAIAGREVMTGETKVRLDTAGIALDEFVADWRTKFLETITDPNVAYLLMLVGIYGLLFEGYSPGAVVPGVVGAICLLLALFAFQVLSVNYAGLALIFLGVALIVAEAFVPSFGALGLGGVVAFVFGSIILMDQSVPGMEISRALIGGVALAGALSLLGMMVMLARIGRRPVVSGVEGMVGETGEALADFSGRGSVFIHGERWQAQSAVPIRQGQPVRVLAVRGLVLDVEPGDGR